jgi:D-inositol-3-phosphate glycosyltransferase
VSFEHAATGAAQVVPDGGACAELWRDAGTLVPARPTARGGHEVAPIGVAAALARLYDDPGERARMASRAHARATDAGLAWPAIAERWAALLAGCTHVKEQQEQASA